MTINFEVNRLNVLKDIIHGIPVIFPAGIVLATKNLFALAPLAYLFLITKKRRNYSPVYFSEIVKLSIKINIMISYDYLGENLLVEEFSGRVNEFEFLDIKKSEIAQTDYPKIRGIVMDFRKARIDFSKKKLQHLLDFFKRYKAIFKNKSIAILTKTVEQLQFGYMLRDHLSDHHVPLRVEHFSSKNAAFKWLDNK